jgi:hypothetical protein
LQKRLLLGLLVALIQRGPNLAPRCHTTRLLRIVMATLVRAGDSANSEMALQKPVKRRADFRKAAAALAEQAPHLPVVELRSSWELRQLLKGANDVLVRQ